MICDPPVDGAVHYKYIELKVLIEVFSSTFVGASGICPATIDTFALYMPSFGFSAFT